MLKRAAAALLALCILMTGCAPSGSDESGRGLVIYRLNTLAHSGGALLVEEVVAYSPEDNAAELILATLNSKPSGAGLGRVFPDGVRALSCSMEKGVATVVMSEDYARLDELDRLLCSGALTLSLCRLDEVCAVSVKCGERFYGRELKPEDFLQADELFQSYERCFKLFLPADNQTGLVPRSICAVIDGDRTLELIVVEKVLEALPVYSESTRVLSAETVDGICTVDLSEAFFGNEPADTRQGMLSIFAIVNSLCRLGNVEGVIISVEGQSVVSYGGYRASWPMTARDELVIY